MTHPYRALPAVLLMVFLMAACGETKKAYQGADRPAGQVVAGKKPP